MAPYLSPKTFPLHVLESLLFQGNLTIPDIFWFISKHVAHDVDLGRRSLLLEGLKQGFVRPHFRAEVDGNFVEALKLVRDQRIIGLLPAADRIAARLFGELEDATGYRYARWPKRLVGRSFLTEVQTSVGLEDPPIAGESAARLWRETRKWRTECVTEALDRANDGTLRRGEWLDVVARHAGAWDSAKPIPGLEEILRLAPRAKKHALRTFGHWVNQCYYRNQARLFRREALVPAGRGLQQLGSLRSPTPEDWEVEAVSLLEITVLLPPSQLLLRTPASKVLGARSSPEGKAFFRASAEWRKVPSYENGYMVADALADYSERLRKDFLGHLRSAAREVLHARLPVIRLPPARVALGLAWLWSKALYPPVGATVALLETAQALEKYLPETFPGIQRLRRGLLVEEKTVRLEKTTSTSFHLNLVLR